MVLDNDGGLDDLAAQVDRLWAELTARAQAADVVTSVMTSTAATSARITRARPVGTSHRALP